VSRKAGCFRGVQWLKAIHLPGEFHPQIAELLGNPEVVDILRSLGAGRARP
jgi:DNA-binding GntR family transcriptional regulator